MKNSQGFAIYEIIIALAITAVLIAVVILGATGKQFKNGIVQENVHDWMEEQNLIQHEYSVECQKYDADRDGLVECVIRRKRSALAPVVLMCSGLEKVPCEKED